MRPTRPPGASRAWVNASVDERAQEAADRNEPDDDDLDWDDED